MSVPCMQKHPDITYRAWQHYGSNTQVSTSSAQHELEDFNGVTLIRAVRTAVVGWFGDCLTHFGPKNREINSVTKTWGVFQKSLYRCYTWKRTLSLKLDVYGGMTS